MGSVVRSPSRTTTPATGDAPGASAPSAAVVRLRSIRGSVEACSEGSCFGFHFWSQTATKQAVVRRIDNQLRAIIISGTAIPTKGYSKKAGELPDTSDHGHGIEEVKHLAVSDDGVIANLDPSERHDRLVFGLEHQITSSCRWINTFGR